MLSSILCSFCAVFTCVMSYSSLESANPYVFGLGIPVTGMVGFIIYCVVAILFRYHKQYYVSCRIHRWNPPIHMCPDWGFQSTIMCYHAVFYAHFVWFFISDLSCAIVLFLVHFMCLLFFMNDLSCAIVLFFMHFMSLFINDLFPL